MMKDKFDKSVGKVLQLAARLHTSRRAEKLAAMGLFPGQEIALQALAHHKSMSMSELAATLQVKPPTVSKMITRLGVQGFVARTGSDGDARQVHVSLTEKGRESAAALSGQWQETEEDMLAKLDAKERKQLRKLLRRVTKGLAKSTDATRDEPGDDADDEAEES
jgi:MarR family transcriptional regulator, transcriptional regulator for hemolysin